MRKSLILLCFVIGCGASIKNKVIPVEGKIALDNGKMLPIGTKLLLNPSEGGVGTASGVTTADGSFDLRHVKGGKGAEVGKYVLVLRAPTDDDKTFYKTVPKAAYEEGISVEIKEGMQPLDLKIKSR